jgi:uncharacterized protein (UPF0333 family)
MENDNIKKKNAGSMISIAIIVIIIIIAGIYLWGSKMATTPKTVIPTQETAEQVIDQTSQDLSNVNLDNLDLNLSTSSSNQ